MSKFTNKDLKRPEAFLHTYKALEVMLIHVNDTVRSYLLMFVNNIMTSMSVGGQVMLITFHDHISLNSQFGMVTLIICSTFYMVITYYKLGELNEASVKVISSWRRCSGLRLKPSDQILMKTYSNALWLFKVELGDFGHYRNATSIRIIGKLIFYTTKGLMLAQKFI